MISAVLFDLDGTLVETEALNAISYGRAVAELRLDVVQAEVVSACTDDLTGHSHREGAEEMVRRFGLEEAVREHMSEMGEEEPWQVLVSIRDGFFAETLADSGLLLEQRYPHNIELLWELRREGYPVALATMSHRHQVERILSVLGLEDAFDVVATADDIRRGKPDPEIDLLVAKELGVPPEEFLVIEDSRAGVGAAVAAGMVVIAVPTRITSKGVCASNLLEPRWVVEDPETLSDIVRQRIEEAGGRREGERRPSTTRQQEVNTQPRT